jgi:hypothetical protein
VAAAREDERFQHYGDEEAAAVTAGETRRTKTVGSSARLFRLDSPATAERIRMACNDRITSLVSYPPIKTNIFRLQHNDDNRKIFLDT